MPGDPHQLFDEIEASIEMAMRDVGTTIADNIKDRIGVPVGYRRGPRGGTQKIRSKPGEPPRKDTGKLQGEIAREVIATEGQIEGSVYSPTDYAEPLEDKLDRPIMTDLDGTYDDLIADRSARAADGE